MLRLFLKVAVLFALGTGLLTACNPAHGRGVSALLHDVESYINERPDSALAVLRGIQTRNLSGVRVRPYCALLLSEALDKNYIDLTDDSLALVANRYYGDHGTKLHRLKSWYYLGRVRFNAGNYAEAVICYNKALEYAEALMHYHYIGLINREIASAYSEVWDNYHATEKLRESIKAFHAANEERYAAYSELALATGLIKLKRYDEAKRVLDEIGEKQDDNYLSAVVYLKKAQLAVNEGSDNYDEVLSDYHAAGIGKTLPVTVSRYTEQAVVHQMAGHVDSADFYLGLADRAIKTGGDSVVFAFDKSQIEALRGNYDLAYGLLSQSFHSQDSSVYAALQQSVSYYQSNHYQNEARINALKARNRFTTYFIIILTLSLVTFLLIVRTRHQKEQIMDEIARTAEIEQELIGMKDEKEGMNRAMAVLFENRMKILQKLSEQYDVLEDKQQKKMRDKGMELSKDEIVDMFRDNMKGLRKDKDIALSMEETLDTWKDGIMRKLRAVFGKDSSSDIRMSEEDFELAPYYFSGMKPKAISFLTGHSEHALRERKHRIKQKINCLDDTHLEEKELFLSNL